MSYDVVWELFKTLSILGWFIGIGAVSTLILCIPSTRNILKKYFNF